MTLFHEAPGHILHTLQLTCNQLVTGHLTQYASSIGVDNKMHYMSLVNADNWCFLGHGKWKTARKYLFER